MKEVKKVEELVGLAEKLVQYKHNLSYTYFFFAFGSLFAGWLLILIATEWIKNPVILILSMIACAITGIVVLKLVFINTFKRIKRRRMEALYWVLAFSVPFVGVYTFLGAFNFPDILFISGFAWYVALGIALTLVAILVENWYVTSKTLLSRPFLIAGIIMLLTAPLLLLVSYQAQQYSGNPLGLGLMLFTYFISGTVTIVRADNVFK